MFPDEMLWKHVEGDLAPAEAARVEEAAASDAALRLRLDEIRVVREEILGGAPRPPDGFAARVAARAVWRRGAPAFDMDEARRFLRRALVAASLLAALGVAYLAVEVLPAVFGPAPMEAAPLLPR
jgi:hypothetical protein